MSWEENLKYLSKTLQLVDTMQWKREKYMTLVSYQKRFT